MLTRSYSVVCSLGVEPVDRDVMNKPPRNVKNPMITKTLITNVLLSASLIVTGTLWVFWREVFEQAISMNLDKVLNSFD